MIKSSRLLTSLYSRFALMLFAVFSVLAVLLVSLNFYSTDMYQQETQQRLSQDLAKHIAHEYQIVDNGMIYTDRLKNMFNRFMEINPAIELYIIDTKGKITGFNAPQEKVKRTHIELAPINKFLSGTSDFPIIANDPRNLDANKIFSVAPLISKGKVLGYLYVILAGEQYENIIARMMDNYIISMSTWAIVIVLIISMLLALLLFKYMTRRISKLSDDMDSFCQSRFKSELSSAQNEMQNMDEIDRLNASFDTMVERIILQMEKLKQSDTQRRELVANVSHDLRTPLTTLQGYLETLLRKSQHLSEEKKQHYLRVAVGHSQRLGCLISELFELARLDANETAPRLESFSLPELIHDAMQRFWPQASERNIIIEADFDNNIPFVMADIGLIERVIQNLLENAVRYTEQGGKIEIGLKDNGHSVIVQIRDDGCGIAEKELPLIFERFYRAEKSRQQHSGGSGLGLAICKRILELHGSSIQAISKLNQGTVFSFYLPKSPA